MTQDVRFDELAAVKLQRLSDKTLAAGEAPRQTHLQHCDPLICIYLTNVSGVVGRVSVLSVRRPIGLWIARGRDDSEELRSSVLQSSCEYFSVMRPLLCSSVSTVEIRPDDSARFP